MQFNRTLPIASLLIGLLAAPLAHAQGIEIDDDGWSRVENKAPDDFRVEIDDDGWSRSDKTVDTMDDVGTVSADCTQLELASGMSGAECGQMSNSDLSREYIGAYD